MGANATRVGRKLSVGEVYRAALSAFGARARVLIPITFVAALFVSVVAHLLGEDNPIGFLVGFVISMAFFPFVTAVAMVTLRDLRERRPDSSVSELLASALPPLPVGTLVATLAFVAVIVGLVFLVAPGLYLLTIWAVVLPVVVVERPGVFDAFGRSRQLVRGNGWRVLGAILLLGLILAISFSITFALQRLFEGPVAQILISSFISGIFTPLQMLVIGVIYYRLLDIEQQPAAASVLQQTGDGPG